MNFIRAAEAVGLGCCPISAVRNHAARISALLEMPDWVFPVAGLCVGYPAEPHRMVPRLSLDTTIHVDTYSDHAMASQIDDYDRRRVATLPYVGQRSTDEYGQAPFYGGRRTKHVRYRHLSGLILASLYAISVFNWNRAKDLS